MDDEYALESTHRYFITKKLTLSSFHTRNGKFMSPHLIQDSNYDNINK